MTQLIGIDLFAGAGGMTLGARQAGINVSFAVENDRNACLSYRNNFLNVNLYDKDIRKLAELPKLVKANEKLVVFGGPPCQGFSTSNQKTRNVSNQNNWLYQEFFRVIKLNNPLPDWIVFENVKGFSETEDGIFLDQVCEELKGLGYMVSYTKLNALNYGVPQRRTRFFIVGSYHGIQFKFPKPESKNEVSVKEAIWDLPILESGAIENWKGYSSDPISEYAKELRNGMKISPNHQVTKNSDIVLNRYKFIPQGGNWQDIPKELMVNYKDSSRCHTGIYHRLKENSPSIVIGNYRKNMLIHPTQNRGLSVREAARLQSFPDCYEFVGSIGYQQQQVGNAVPPKLAKVIFENIISYE